MDAIIMHHVNVGYCGLETARRYELPVVIFVATPELATLCVTCKRYNLSALQLCIGNPKAPISSSVPHVYFLWMFLNKGKTQ